METGNTPNIRQLYFVTKAMCVIGIDLVLNNFNFNDVISNNHYVEYKTRFVKR